MPRRESYSSSSRPRTPERAANPRRDGLRHDRLQDLARAVPAGVEVAVGAEDQAGDAKGTEPVAGGEDPLEGPGAAVVAQGLAAEAAADQQVGGRGRQHPSERA
jgi:hypothetical protein